nr:MAG: hypothetical protein [White spot syndrome virus]BDX27462.1 MAG: hypothetical protein [White spot syndrome virus]
MSNTNAPVLILVIFLIIAALVAVGFFVFSNNGGRRSLGGSDNKRQKTGGGGGGGSGGGVSGSGGGGGIITLPTVNSGTDTDDEFVPNRELSPREKMDLRRLVKSKLLEDLEQKPESYYEDMTTPKFNTLADELEPKLKEDFSASDQLAVEKSVEDILKEFERSQLFTMAGMKDSSMRSNANSVVRDVKVKVDEKLAAEALVESIYNKSVVPPKGVLTKTENLQELPVPDPVITVTKADWVQSLMDMSKKVASSSILEGFIAKQPLEQMLTINRFGFEVDLGRGTIINYFDSVNSKDVIFRLRTDGDGLSNQSERHKQYVDFYIDIDKITTIAEIDVVNRCDTKCFSMMPIIHPVGGKCPTSIYSDNIMRDGTYLYVACKNDKVNFKCRLETYSRPYISGMVIDLLILEEDAPVRIQNRIPEQTILSDSGMHAILGTRLSTRLGV